MILLSSRAPDKSAKTWIIHREMDKGLICIDFAPPQWKSFFVQENRPTKSHKKINSIFNMVIKEENRETVALLVY